MAGAGQAGDAQTRAARKGIWGWMFFDWAAQPFFTVVTTFIFGPYFISRMVLDANGNPDPVAGQAAWGYAIAIGGVIMAILAPILGSIADQTGPRKPWIGFFAAIKIAGLCFLWNAAPGSSVFWILFAYTMAAVAAEFSTVFNDSMLPRLVRNEQIGVVSNTAWGLGYMGGMIVLIIVLVFLAGNPPNGKTIAELTPLFGLDPVHGEDARITGPLAALWYFVFILPMFLFTPDKGISRPLGTAVKRGMKELGETLRELRNRIGLVRFLVARMIYQDGVGALIALGGGFAAGMFGWSVVELGVYGIILNVTAIGGSFAGGWFDTRFGSKWVVKWAVLLLIGATLGIVSTGTHPTIRMEFDNAKLSQLSLDQAAALDKLVAEKIISPSETVRLSDQSVTVRLTTSIYKLEGTKLIDGNAASTLPNVARLEQAGYTLFGAIQFAPHSVNGLFATGAEKAYIVFGLLIGLVFGPVQASSRAYMARSVSVEETGRYFGIYALSGRATSFLCPLLVATVTSLTGSAHLGIAMILPFFVVGLLILFYTPYPAHRPAAA